MTQPSIEAFDFVAYRGGLELRVSKPETRVGAGLPSVSVISLLTRLSLARSCEPRTSCWSHWSSASLSFLYILGSFCEGKSWYNAKFDAIFSSTQELPGLPFLSCSSDRLVGNSLCSPVWMTKARWEIHLPNFSS